jgi:ankyrin repeat protein
VDVNAKLAGLGRTGLHSAAWGGHVDIVRMLLQRGAATDRIDDTHDGTALGWALYSWGTSAKTEAHAESLCEVVRLLVRAGAKVDAEWFGANEERRRVARKMESDERMRRALRGE